MLDDAASKALRRGAPDAAAELLERAAALTPGRDGDARMRRKLDAAECHFEAGASDRARHCPAPRSCVDTWSFRKRLAGKDERLGERACAGSSGSWSGRSGTETMGERTLIRRRASSGARKRQLAGKATRTW
jgi:hypothetical protein